MSFKVSNEVKNGNIRIQSGFIIGSKTEKDMPLTLQLRRFLCIFKTIIGLTKHWDFSYSSFFTSVHRYYSKSNCLLCAALNVTINKVNYLKKCLLYSRDSP